MKKEKEKKEKKSPITPRTGRLKKVRQITQRTTARKAPSTYLDAHVLSHNQCPADLVASLSMSRAR